MFDVIFYFLPCEFSMKGLLMQIGTVIKQRFASRCDDLILFCGKNISSLEFSD